MFRDGNHMLVSALFPVTMEQLQAENLALRQSLMGQQGGARINVPACPVI